MIYFIFIFILMLAVLGLVFGPYGIRQYRKYRIVRNPNRTKVWLDDCEIYNKTLTAENVTRECSPVVTRVNTFKREKYDGSKKDHVDKLAVLAPELVNGTQKYKYAVVKVFELSENKEAYEFAKSITIPYTYPAAIQTKF